MQLTLASEPFGGRFGSIFFCSEEAPWSSKRIGDTVSALLRCFAELPLLFRTCRLILDGAKQLCDSSAKAGPLAGPAGASQSRIASLQMPCNTFELEMRGIKHAEASPNDQTTQKDGDLGALPPWAVRLEAIRVLVDFLYGSPTWTKHQVSEEAGSRTFLLFLQCMYNTRHGKADRGGWTD